MKFGAHLAVDESVMRRVKDKLRGALGKVAAHRASVGIHENEGGEIKRGYDDKAATGKTVAEVAAIHEFGAGGLPERSFLRAWFDANVGRLKSEMATAMRSEYSGDKDAVRRQAQLWGAELHDFVAKGGNLTPVTLDTYKRKEAAGLDHPETPLVATHQLIESIKALLDGAPA